MKCRGAVESRTILPGVRQQSGWPSRPRPAYLSSLVSHPIRIGKAEDTANYTDYGTATLKTQQGIGSGKVACEGEGELRVFGELRSMYNFPHRARLRNTT